MRRAAGAEAMSMTFLHTPIYFFGLDRSRDYETLARDTATEEESRGRRTADTWPRTPDLGAATSGQTTLATSVLRARHFTKVSLFAHDDPTGAGNSELEMRSPAAIEFHSIATARRDLME
jgi:hypothetical protein